MHNPNQPYPHYGGNPLQANYGGVVQGDPQYAMKKQKGPSEISNQDYYPPPGYYSTPPGPISGNRINNTSAGGYSPLVNTNLQGNYVFQQGYNPQGPPQTQGNQTSQGFGSAPGPSNQPQVQTVTPSTPKSSGQSAPDASRVAVDAETTYPKPNKVSNLLAIFAQDPEKFEEYIQAKLEASINKRIHDKLAPFKVEVAQLLEGIGKSNIDEVSMLGKTVVNMESVLKSQEKQIDSLNDKYQLAVSQIKLLENTGVKNGFQEEQLSAMEKIRENMRAEVNMVLNQRLQEEATGLEDRIGKKIEEMEKRIKTHDKRAETFKIEQEEHRREQESLMARLEDMNRLIFDVSNSSPKSDNKAELDSLRQNLDNLAKYREEDQQKFLSFQGQIDEAKRENLNKLETLERFVMSIKEAKDHESKQQKPENSFDLSSQVIEDIKGLKNNVDHLNYKMDNVTYDLSHIKADILRMKGSQTDCFAKVDKLEKKLDTMPLSNVPRPINMSQNFMTSISQSQQQILGPLHGISPVHVPPPKKENLQANYIEEDDREDNYASEFGANMSIIQKANLNNEDTLFDGDDLFLSNPNGKMPSTFMMGGFDMPNRNSIGHPQDQRKMAPIPEVFKEDDASKSQVSGDGSPAKHQNENGGSSGTNQNFFNQAPQNPTPPHPITRPGYNQGPVNPNFNSSPPHVGFNQNPTYNNGPTYNNSPSYNNGPTGLTYYSGTSGGPTHHQYGNPFTPPQNPPQPPASQSHTPVMRKVTGGSDQNTSLLNQSLNSSIRVQKGLLKRMDQSIADNAGRGQMEDSIIELNIDDDGYLIDQNGQYIFNDNGEKMKLTEENLEFLKENGLYEEEEMEDGGR